MPTKPLRSASVSICSICDCSAAVGLTSSRVARSSPMTAARMSEWPRNAATLGPSGRASSAAMYSSPLDHVLCVFTAAMTCSRGMASTRPKMSPASSASTYTVDSEQDPSITVVTPWRRDSVRAGPPRTSMS